METEHQFSPDKSSGSDAEVDAALALGRLDGALEHAPDNVLRIFAAHILRDALVAALRQQGHTFTDQRFYAWFAGLTTLSNTASRHVFPPRALCEAVLTALSYSSWPPLADIAFRMSPAFLAPRDLNTEDAHATVHEVIGEAQTLVEEHQHKCSAPLFSSLAQLHRDVLTNVRFAPPERYPAPFEREARPPLIEQLSASPLWAIELHFGEHLRAARWLRPALPLIGLIRRDALEEDDAEIARIRRANALHNVAHDMHRKLGEAVRISLFEAVRLPNRRSTSRAPALFEVLAGFGSLRSAQMERVLGASRLGVRGMLAALTAEQMIERGTIAGSHLYSASAGDRTHLVRPDETGESAFSTDALDAFNASMAHLDDLLARRPKE